MKFSRLALTIGALFAATHSYGEDTPLENQASREFVEHFLVNAADAPPEGVTDLQFREFFAPGDGPRGLVPTDKLRALAGKPVRLIGYMARPDARAPGMLVLGSRRTTVDDDSEALAPEDSEFLAFVHLDAASRQAVPHLPGLLKFTGILELGPQEEACGRRSRVRLRLDAEASRLLLAGAPA